jgi:hypothetical protein
MSSDCPLVPFGCALHASTDFREKLYKILQYAAKLAASQPGASKRAGHIAATLSQSRGIFKLLKLVNNVESYQKSLVEADPVLARLCKLESYLNTIVSAMQDLITIDKLCLTNALSKQFSWWMNFLDLLLSVLLAIIASYSHRQLLTSGVDSPKAQRQLLLLRLELGVRIGDAIALLQETSKYPGSSQPMWSAPSARTAMLASLASAACATSAVAIKKWAALPAPSPVSVAAAANGTVSVKKVR